MSLASINCSIADEDESNAAQLITSILLLREQPSRGPADLTRRQPAWGMGVKDMSLYFDGFEVATLFASCLYVNLLILNGKSN